MLSICAISDLHGLLPKIKKCDLCLIAGDIMPLDVQNSKTDSIVWLYKTFLPWIKELPCQEVFIVAGNHDKIAESMPPVMQALVYLSDFKLSYLKNTYEIFRANDGQNLKIYGSPQCHKFGNWAFMHEESFLEGLYSEVPDDIDIWLTHDTPALGDLDLLPPSQWNPQAVHAGGKSLANRIIEVRPKYVFCGHLHTCKDKYYELKDANNKSVQIYNVSILDNNYAHVYEPTYVDIN